MQYGLALLGTVFLIVVGVMNKEKATTPDVETTEKSEIKIQPDSLDISVFSDALLQEKLDRVIASQPVWNDLVKKRKMAVSIMDLTPGVPKYAAANGKNMMYAASLPKIGVLLAAEDALANGELKDSPELEKDMRLMIAKSNNQATTRIIDMIGLDKIANVLQHKYGFYDTNKGGGLWVGKRYGAGGATNREPLKNLSHAASVDEVTKFYYLLYRRQLISPSRSEHMLSLLVDPELHHKFVASLDKLAPRSKVYRKSGTWQTWHADSAMILDDDKKYIIVALINDSRGEQIIRNLVEPLSDIVTSR